MSGPFILRVFFLLQLVPIDITSSHMEMNMREKKAEFIGDVVAKQGDVILTCRRLTAFYGKDTRQVERLVATGQVRITQKDRVAAGERAEYDNIRRILRLTGSPRVWQGHDMIEGDEILVFLSEGKVRVTHAQATYLPGQESSGMSPTSGTTGH